MHLVMCGHFRSRRLIRRRRKPHATRKFHGSMFYRTGLIADRSFTLWQWEFSPFLAPVTLTLTDDLHIRTQPVVHGDIPRVRK